MGSMLVVSAEMGRNNGLATILTGAPSEATAGAACGTKGRREALLKCSTARVKAFFFRGSTTGGCFGAPSAPKSTGIAGAGADRGAGLSLALANPLERRLWRTCGVAPFRSGRLKSMELGRAIVAGLSAPAVSTFSGRGCADSDGASAADSSSVSALARAAFAGSACSPINVRAVAPRKDASCMARVSANWVLFMGSVMACCGGAIELLQLGSVVGGSSLVVNLHVSSASFCNNLMHVSSTSP